MLARRAERGDTIIEVLFAFTVFSLLAVGASIVMNQGLAAAQKSLEITLVRQQIDAQAEAIRYVRDEAFKFSTGTNTSEAQKASEDWKKMTKSAPDGDVATAASAFGTLPDGLCQTPPPSAFVLDAHNGVLSAKEPKVFDASSPPYSQVEYLSPASDDIEAYGIWVESVKADDANKYVDFHIRACWNAPGSGPSATLGTIVRLYAPL